jgi:RHS repeat-associated protein
VGTSTVTITGTSGSLTASTTVALTVTAPQCTSNGYSYQRAIVIDHTKVPNTDQTNFPFLFNTIDPAFAWTSNNGHVASQSGDDIIFSTDPNGFTKLDHELEEYNPQTGQVIAWVRIPTLSHTADTVLYMFYGNPSIGTPQQNPTGVWDSNFGGVWHLGGNGPVPSTADSTANANLGTVVGSVSETSGEIGNGTALSGGSNYIDAGNSPSVLPSHTGTFSVWVNYNAFNNWTTPMGNGNTGNDTNGAMFWNYSGGQLRFEVAGANGLDRASGPTLATGQWYYLTGSWDGSNVNLYTNGALVQSVTQTTDARPDYHLTLGVDGALSGSGDYLNGILEEARVSGIARSADWIATEYSNQSSPSAFYALNSEADLVSPSAVTLHASQSQQFTFAGWGVCGANVTWSIIPEDGAINSGMYTAPDSIATLHTVKVTATTITGPSQTGTATVTLKPPPVYISLTPFNAILYGGQSLQFNATIKGSSNTTVNWTLTPAGTPAEVGAISPTGLYTAPAAISGQQAVIVTAISDADPTVTTSAVVTLVLAKPNIAVSANTGLTYQPNQTIAVAINAQNTGNADAASTSIRIVNPDASTTTLAAFPLAAGQNSAQQVSYTVPAIPPPPTPQPLPASTDSSLFNVNIIVNGDAEAAPGGLSDATAASVPGWTRTGTFTTIVYGNCCGYPLLTDPGPINRGSNFFGGGDGSPVSTASQNIDVGAAAGLIDSGLVKYNFSAYLGGVAGQGDYAVITAAYQDSKGNTISTATLGPETEQERGGITGLYLCSTEGSLPPGTRKVTVTMTMTRFAGIDNDGYADNLSLVLSGPSSSGGDDSGTTNYLESLTAHDDSILHFNIQTNWSDNSGVTYGPISTVAQATEVLPIANVSLSASPSGISGSTIKYVATITNTGHATASGLTASITLPDGTTQALSLPSTTLAPQASMSATSSFVIPLAQLSGSLFARVAVTWTDGANNSYGPVLSTASTSIAQLAVVLQNDTFTTAPTAPGPYIAGTSQTFIATLTDPTGAQVPGVTISFNATGANTSSGSTTTGANGTASFTYTGVNVGIDNVQASINLGAASLTTNGVPVSWVTPIQQLSTTQLTGAFYSADGSGVFNATPSTPVAFTQSFPTIGFNPPAGVVPNNSAASIGLEAPFTDITTDIAGNFSGILPTRAGSGTLTAFQSAFTGSLLVSSPGSITFTVYSDNGFVLGIGNSAVAAGGANVNPPQSGVTAIAGLPVMGAYNQASAPSAGSTITVNFPQPGNYPYELDYANTGVSTPMLTVASSANSGLIVPPAGALLLTPISVPPQSTGNTQAVTVNVTDAMGNHLAKQAVALTVTGANPNEFDVHYNTDANGNVSYSYTGANAGMDFVQATTLLAGNLISSNALTVQWGSQSGSPSPTGPSVSITSNTTVTLPNELSLSGTVTGFGNTFTTTWSQVNGPGTATFDTPNQPSTNAAFDAPGVYVLQLRVSGGQITQYAQVSITVNPVSEMPQGWVGSPINGSAVSGVVPIILAPGVTLQSGTLNPPNALTYYPASNPSNIMPLPITAESGTIGTLDTTMLPNGTYWIELQATNTSGNFEYSLVLVTISGNYKPGRVTATVTDLVVPATGLAINIQRNYDSLTAATSSDFGYGWSLGINVNLTVDPAGNVTFTLGGQRKTFYLTPQPPSLGILGFLPWYWPAYTPEPGLHGTLTDSGLGCPALDILVPNGNLWYCQTGGQYNPPGYVYTDPNGTSYTISAAGNLQSIQDLSGNGLAITPYGITSTTGLNVPFVRDANHNNRITQITDPAGNIYQYAYDASGNLHSVTYPNTSPSNPVCSGATAPNTSIYNYDSNHRYTGGTDALCHPLPLTAYFNSVNDGGNSALDGRLESVSDALGETTSYSYTLSTTSTINGVSVPNTGVTTITYPADGSGNVGTATMIYDSFGDLLQSEDPNKLTTVNVYDANHNPILVTDPLNHVTSYTYDSNGNKTSSSYQATPTSHNTTSSTYYNQYSEPTSTVDELGNARFFNYDANYLPQSVTDSIGTLASFVFNPNSTLAAGAIGFDITANPAQASQFTYDANGNMASRTDALGRTTSYTYDSFGHKLSMTTPTPASLTGSAASTTSYGYDALGNLTSTTAPLGRDTGSAYDVNGNKVSDTDARGNTTNYVYDALNRLVETDYPTTPATKSTKTYDFRNNVLKETDQANNVTQHVYDPAGRQTSVTHGFGSTTTTPSTTYYTYYDDGRKATETDPANNVTNYYYDAAGRLTSVTGAQGTTTYAYDDAGNRISSKDGNNNTTSFQYDARKRLIETDYPATANYPDGTSVKNTYDGPGNLASVTDQAENVLNYTYDAANQLLTVVQHNAPNQPTLTNNYAYDPLGSLTSLEDARNNTTQNLFDLYGEPLQKTLPITTFTESRTYDPAGNLSTLVHFNGKTTTYAYDALNRLLSRATPGEPSDSVSFTYTATGKYLTSTAQDGTVNYGYDSLDRLTTKATPEGTLSYTYYPTGKVETIVSSNPNGVKAAYTYDAQNRLATVVDARLPGANTTTYTYDPASNLATVQIPNGLTSTFTYDALNRLTELSTPPVADYKYTLGATGIRTNATEQSGRTLQWSYDNIYRLTGETITGDPANNGNNNGSATYGLDPVGNRTTEASSLSGINPIAGTYNANDQLTSSETYDANGNTTHTANGNSYTYDSENHMITMTNGATVVNLIYDAFGNRVAKTVNGVTTQYLVEDDVNPTGYPQVVEELVNGVVTRQYTYGLQRISENLSPALSGNSTWTPSFYGYDGFGSVRQLTNSSGVVTDSYEYDAFGNSFTKQGATPNNYLYRGELFDADLGLYYLRHRYMNPLTGRFMSRDPKEYKPLGPDQQLYDAEVQPIDPRKLHTYLYASADPVNRIDPKGLEDEVEDAMDNLESISKFQNKVRKGQITNRIIDCIQKSFDEVDHVLEDIVRGKIDPGDY